MRQTSVPPWFDDGIVFLDGEKPWEGLIGPYRKGQLSYAVASRDARSGETFDPREFFTFISVDDFKESLKQIPPQMASLDKPLNELNALLNRRETSEEVYHLWFSKYPCKERTEYIKTPEYVRLREGFARKSGEVILCKVI